MSFFIKIPHNLQLLVLIYQHQNQKSFYLGMTMDDETREKLEAAYDFCDASIVILEKVNVTETNSVLTLLKYQRRILDTVLFPEEK